METIYTIYKATNKTNGKSYIGFDSNWPNRKRNHINEAKREKTNNIVFHNALRRYGKNTFIWEILSQSKDGIYLLKVMEPYFIKKNNTFKPNGYNMTLGGEGVLGLKFSKDSIKKLSESHKGIRHSPETRRKMSISAKKYKKTEEHCKNLSKSLMGKRKSRIGVEKQAAKVSKLWKVTTPLREEKIILNLNKFCRENDLTHTLMTKVANGENSHHKGWKCEYYIENQELINKV